MHPHLNFQTPHLLPGPAGQLIGQRVFDRRFAGLQLYSQFLTGTIPTDLLTGTFPSNRLVGPIPQNLILAHGASLARSAPQAIGNVTNTLVSLDVESIDTDGYHSGGGTRITVPSGLAGNYVAGCFVQWDGANARSPFGARTALIFLDSAAVVVEFDRTSDAVTPACRMSMATLLPLAVGDYLELMVWQSSGTTLSVTAMNLWAAWVGS